MSAELDECIHGLGLVTACTICNGRDKREAAEAAVVVAYFTARFDGVCYRCADPWSPGEMIAKTAGGHYLCRRCS